MSQIHAVTITLMHLCSVSLAKDYNSSILFLMQAGDTLMNPLNFFSALASSAIQALVPGFVGFQVLNYYTIINLLILCVCMAQLYDCYQEYIIKREGECPTLV